MKSSLTLTVSFAFIALVTLTLADSEPYSVNVCEDGETFIPSIWECDGEDDCGEMSEEQVNHLLGNNQQQPSY